MFEDFDEDRWDDDGGYLTTRECQEEENHANVNDPEQY